VQVDQNCPNCGAEMPIIERAENICPECEAKVWIDDGDPVWQTVEDQLGIPRVVLDHDPPVPALDGVANRSSGMLKVRCPHCGHVNEFPGWSEMFVFVCDQCGDPVNVVEPVQ
jgi:DNA-directed RNA polymerase subunit RPC12/RpoP